MNADLLNEIWATARRNKLRTALTGFAVAWGIFMIIFLLGAGNGLINAMEHNSGQFLDNSMVVSGGWTTMPYDGLKEDRSIELNTRDMDATNEGFSDHVENVGAKVSQQGLDVSKDANYFKGELSGVYPNEDIINKRKMLAGRFINDIDIERRRKVVVMDDKLARQLVSDPASLIGQYVHVGPFAFQVVGIYQADENSRSTEVYSAFTTVSTMFSKGNRIDNISFTFHGLDTKEQNEAFEDSYRAHAYASVLGPIIGNIGNFLYAALALVGGVLLLIGVPNLSLSGKALDISILVPFLNMTKQFTGNINQLSQQINSIVMAGAGAQRVFSLIDEKAETDDGFVTLVDADIAPDGTISKSDHHTGHWAWRNPNDNGKVSYRELRGDVRLIDVDFGYEPNKEVLHDVSVYAEPGQKVAFVGATGAGKTTITNLINRFYDIADGQILYDGIDVSKIKKADLRRSLGIVLQDVNLFTGTVMDNIRYGKLNATDEECIAAAKLAGADDFITRLPQGYATELANNGANLSQGQRQLISIARAAVADPPVMILDEATSSIDTRTEAIVQRGMDQLMEGRTVFVIAHRLSTVKNSDVIMVLDHGRIIERGSHEKLIAEKGTYYQLYTGAFELE